MKNFIVKMLLIVSTCGFNPSVLAENCYMVDPCAGQVGLLRIDKMASANRQGDIKALFGSTQAPAPGTVVVLQRSARLRYDFFPDADRDLNRKDEVCMGLECLDKDSPERGSDYLPAGTTVRILSYQLHKHLFVLIQVVATPSDHPYEDEKKFSFDKDDVI